MKWGSVIPIKTEKSLSQEPLVVIIHWPSPESRNKIMMVGNGGPVTGFLINIITKYRGYKNVCVNVSFPVLPFR